MTYALKDLLDVPRLQGMLDALDEIYSLPSAIIDAEGAILTATAWQEICTKFHRVNPETERQCRESDTRIACELGRTAGPVVYTCPLGLVDTATPILVDGVGLGNVFTGQLFTSAPDEGRFVEQARRYGFDERDYLAAMRKVPVVTEERLRKNLAFLGDFTQMLAEMGARKKRQLEIDAALQRSEARYRRIAEGLTDYLYSVRVEEGQAVDTTHGPACETVTGYSAEEFAADPCLWISMVPAEERDRVRARVHQVLAGEDVPPIEHRIVRKDGQTRWVREAIILFRDAAGRLASYDGVVKDVTENRDLEAQLQQSQKLEALGALAGGVAHDFNNIMTIISGYTHLIQMRMAPEDPQRQSLQHIIEASSRATHLTGDLLLFSRKHPVDRKPVDLNEGIRKLGAFLARVIGEDIAFDVRLSDGEIPILADEHQISQILMNLATNARDAMPDGGTFSIRTETVRLDGGSDVAPHGAPPGSYGLITVSDTGAGMDETSRQRIFEPFFTTKDPGKGTGLGMAVLYGIVKQHDGLVAVDSAPGEGTTFRVYLPVLGAGAAEGEATVPAEDPAGGTETILLAEDDAAVREMTRLLLRDYGYTVIGAVDGEDAVRKYAENAERIQLLLFDMVMPKMSGKDAYDEIRRLNPEVKVIFASGYDPDGGRQRTLREMKIPMIRKPMDMPVLLKMIRAALDG